MEVEAKFRATPEVLRRLLDAEQLAGYALAAPVHADLEDLYLDTDTNALRGAGYAFRERRSGGAASLYTLKTLPDREAGILEREEIEQELPPGTPPEDWPEGPLREAVLALTKGEALYPLLEVRQDRTTRQMLGNGQQVAELALDHIRLSTPGGTKEDAIVEVELTDGVPREVLEVVAGVMQEEWDLETEHRSKFQLALEAAGLLPEAPLVSPSDPPAEFGAAELKRPGIEADDAMARAAQKTLAFHFARVERHESGTLEGTDIEELHDMRVATRRMRAALRTFDGYLDPRDSRPLLKGLRRTGRALGSVRDLDVAGERIRAFEESVSGSEGLSADGLVQAWMAERKGARKQLRRYLAGKQYDSWKRETRVFLQTELDSQPLLDRRGEPRAYRLRHVVPVAVYARYGEVLAYDDWVSGDEPPAERLHQLRIAAKGLRYCLEFFQEILGPEARPLIEELKGVQDHLGEFHDAVVDCGVLEGLLDGRTWGGAPQKNPALSEEDTVAIALFRDHRQARRDELVKTFPQRWARFRRGEFAADLAVAVGGLSM